MADADKCVMCGEIIPECTHICVKCDIPEPKLYTRHEVAVILAEAFGDNCACNFNSNDEWLPEKCELLSACPNPVGVACWEQYLKYKEGRE